MDVPAYFIHPPLLDEAGFASAARWYVRLDLPPELSRLPRGVELTLFRILQESLTNVNRHSGSQAVEIHLNVDAEGVTLQVSDFGHGIPAEKLERYPTEGDDRRCGVGGNDGTDRRPGRRVESSIQRTRHRPDGYHSAAFDRLT